MAKDPSTKLTQLLFDSYMRTSKGMHTLFPTCGHLPYPGYPTLTVDNMFSIGLHPARLLSVPVPGTEAFASASRCPLNRLPVGLPASVSEHCLPLEPWSPSSALWLRNLIPLFPCLVEPESGKEPGGQSPIFQFVPEPSHPHTPPSYLVPGC